MGFTYDAERSFGWYPHGSVPTDTASVPTGYRMHNFSRLENVTALTQTSGTSLVAQIWLPAGLTINGLAFVGGAAATTPSHSWMAIWGYDRYVFGTSTDHTTTTIAATVNTYGILSFVTAYEGVYYVELLQVATTPATVLGVAGNATLFGLAPIVGGTGAASQTTQPTLGTIRTAITATANLPYVLAY